MLGNHGLKPPAVTRQHNNCFAWVITQQEVPIRNTELISYCQKERVHQPITCPAKPPETFMLKPIVAEGRLHSQGLWVRPNRANKQEDWPEKTQKANPITIKPETVSLLAEQFSWVLLPHHSLPGCPFPMKSFVLPAHVSPWAICFWQTKDHFRPWKDSLFLQHLCAWVCGLQSLTSLHAWWHRLTTSFLVLFST